MKKKKNNANSFDRVQVREILDYCEEDRQIWDQELEDFVPRKIFDAHTHLWNKAFSKDANPPNDWENYDTGFKEVQNISSLLYPQRETHFLSFPSPVRNTDHKGVSEWTAQEISQDKDSRCAMLLHPEMAEEEIDSFLKIYSNCVALKPYFAMIDKKMPSIAEYFPEAHMEIANTWKMPVIIHLPGAPENFLEELEYYNSKYPEIKWIMAHCAASFKPEQLERAIKRLAAIPNIFYDSALICEAETFRSLFAYEKRKRIFFGSDNSLIIGGCRRNVSFNFHGREFRIFRVYAELIAIRDAFRSLEISPEETEDFFFRNAENLLRRD